MDGFVHSWPLVVTLAISMFLAAISFLAACMAVAASGEDDDDPEWFVEITDAERRAS